MWKKLILILSSMTIFSSVAYSQELTGDTKLACEALLCLSSSTQPGECAPALKRYFSIDHKKLSDTIKDRKNFLNLCPTGNSDQKVAELKSAIAEGAGRCEPKQLNAINRTNSFTVYTRQWTGQTVRVPDDKRYKTVKVYAYDSYPSVKNKLPAFCVALVGHEYVYQQDLVYIGDPMQGGFWAYKHDQQGEQVKYDQKLAERKQKALSISPHPVEYSTTPYPENVNN